MYVNYSTDLRLLLRHPVQSPGSVFFCQNRILIPESSSGIFFFKFEHTLELLLGTGGLFFPEGIRRCPFSRISVKITRYSRIQGIRTPRPRISVSPPPSSGPIGTIILQLRDSPLIKHACTILVTA